MPSKGNANRRSLDDRIKTYEAVTTGASLIEKLPIYCRIDMRAGHTWCHKLDRPFDADYSSAMKEATKFIVEKTGAALGFCQSDEASFVWLDHTKIPFETRLFKLQSVLASMFTAAFMKACLGTKLEQHMWERLPSFDCRVLNMPSLEEAANAIVWRSQDSVKNSITLLALEHFSTKQIHRKNGDDKIKMLHEKGIDYFKAVPEDLRIGAFFRRETYMKTLTDDEINRIPEKSRKYDEDGKMRAVRSHVIQFNIGMKLSEIGNKVGVLFLGENPVPRSQIVNS